MMEYCKCGNEIRYCGTPRCGWPPKEQASTGNDDFERLLMVATQVVQSPTSKAAHAALKNAVEFYNGKGNE